MYAAVVRKGDSVSQERHFGSPYDAAEYFQELCEQRFDGMTLAVLQLEGADVKTYRLDRDYPDNKRLVLDNDLI